jgi:pyruvate-formate lyase-activating enzyme
MVELSDKEISLADADQKLESLCISPCRPDALSISGGEPTLHRGLADILAVARRRGFKNIILQTNAVQLSRPGAVADLGPATFLVSLHSHMPAVYAAITRTRGQFPLALEGIRNILRSGAKLLLNTVVNRLNLEHLPGYVDFVAGFAGEQRKNVHVFFSMMNDVGLRKVPKLAVDLAEAAPHLNAAVERCRRLGVGIAPFDGECAFPVCLLDSVGPSPIGSAPHQAAVLYGSIPKDADPGARVKRPECRGCAYDCACLGVFAAYARRFGLGALRPQQWPAK